MATPRRFTFLAVLLPLLAIGVGLVFAAPAMAQEDDDDSTSNGEDDDEEEVVVPSDEPSVDDSDDVDLEPPSDHPAPEFRDEGDYLLVCLDDAGEFAERNAELEYNQAFRNEELFGQCENDGYHDPQEAIDDADDGDRIMILPGRYTLDEPLTIEEREELQIEGTGSEPGHVILDADFELDEGLIVTESPGTYLANFSVQRSRDVGVSFTNTDTFTVDRVAGRINGAYGLSFTDVTDGRVVECQASGNPSAGIYAENTPASDEQEWGLDIAGCEAQENLIGISVTGFGDVFMRGNHLLENSTGLLVRATDPENHQLLAESNLIGDNNTDYYHHLETEACDADLADREWRDNVLCPVDSVPAGVGVLIAGSSDNTITDNRIWGHDEAGAMLWWHPRILLSDFEVTTQTEASHENHFYDNEMSRRDDGMRIPNSADFWWDGQGDGNCFQSGSRHPTPSSLPACSDWLGPDRWVGDPVRLAKLMHCSSADPARGELASGCDWFTATGTERLEFRVAVAFVALVFVLTGAGWISATRTNNPPALSAMFFASTTVFAGAVLLIMATWSQRADYEALSLGLLAAGWVLSGLAWQKAGRHAIGGMTQVLAAVVAVDALDRGLWMLPWIPFSPTWLWLLLFPLWGIMIVIAMWTKPRERVEIPDDEVAELQPHAHNRFDW